MEPFGEIRGLILHMFTANNAPQEKRESGYYFFTLQTREFSGYNYIDKK